MTFDAGRIRHDGALMHYSRASNGSAIASNWRLSATGDTGVVWTPETTGGAELTAAVFGYQPHGNLGSTETFDATAAGWHSGTLDADCTFTLTGATSGQAAEILLELAQDGTGGRTITLPSSVVNKTDLEASQDTTASQTTFLLLISRDGGTNWYGFWVGGSAVQALDDLSDVTITSVASGDRLRYNGAAWVNSPLAWVPLTNGDATSPELIFAGGDVVMTEVTP